MKSASASPRVGAREPGRYYWYSARIVPIDYQSKRRDVVYGCAALALRHSSRKNFLLEG